MLWNDRLGLILQDFFVPFYCHNNSLLNPAVQAQVTDSPWALLCCPHSQGDVRYRGGYAMGFHGTATLCSKLLPNKFEVGSY